MRRLAALLLLAGCGVAPAPGQTRPTTTTTAAPSSTVIVPVPDQTGPVKLVGVPFCWDGGWGVGWGLVDPPEGATVVQSISEPTVTPLSWTGWSATNLATAT